MTNRRERLESIMKGRYTSFFLIAGPCVIEDLETCVEVALGLKEICETLEIPYVFKASFRKANRTRGDAFTGIGDGPAKAILEEIRTRHDLLVTTDIHETGDLEHIQDWCDIIQIPAFLCRQTQLLVSAGRTGMPVNIKKGQFISADAMAFAAEKVATQNKGAVMLTERGNFYGYTDLVVDYRNIILMTEIGHPVIMDCTHSGQKPNTASGTTTASGDYAELFARLALAAGAHGLFMEVHPSPGKALSDAANMLSLDTAIEMIKRIHQFKMAIR